MRSRYTGILEDRIVWLCLCVLILTKMFQQTITMPCAKFNYFDRILYPKWRTKFTLYVKFHNVCLNTSCKGISLYGIQLYQHCFIKDPMSYQLFTKSLANAYPILLVLTSTATNTNLQQVSNSFCKADHVHCNSYSIGHRKHKAYSPSVLRPQTSWYHIICPTWKTHNR